ncbi:hypothetical protein J0664_06230 [Rhizobium leguminosarum]|uniref:hypothetical protein n=1 Tax=Rhizobium leguminosarum TaxID=384 RepID=UPI001A938375|nr:hypothetical protein [Rhizobium leguminosarum]MBY5553692.1 hypothetical protein [Rhizobium leguminosarum]QSW24893.1 hypothetical protein J0664_06230 [Rhizobium leguminosarum]
MDISRILDKVCIYWHPTGSRFICDPPVMDTDEDYVCLMTDEDVLFDLGFNCTTQEDPTYELSDFSTWRHKHYNLVVTGNLPFYEKFVAATNEAKEKNILDKGERIQLFQKVLYGGDVERADLPW